MNYIKHLTGFFNRIAFEKSLNPTHISLYITIFQFWNVNRFKNPITVTRYEMMKGSKISSNATYHKCIKELQRLGYLEYIPSFNPYSGTLITVFDFSDADKSKFFDKEATSSKNERATPKNEQVIGQGTEQDDSQLYIYNKKTNKNIKNLYIEPEFQISNQDPLFLNPKKENEMLFAFADTKKEQTEESRQKSSAKKEKGMNESPPLELVKDYFKFQEYSEFEAERFFNYYSSNGWLIGGKTKMKDWKASARNWMLNTSKFSVNIPQNNNIPHIHSGREQPRAQNLHTLTDKNYAEPL
jgi:hypothetical protein